MRLIKLKDSSVGKFIIVRGKLGLIKAFEINTKGEKVAIVKILNLPVNL